MSQPDVGRDGGADGSIDLFEIHIASLAAVRGNTQNQPEKSCYRSNFSLRLSRPIIRLGGECVGFRLILCVSSYCCLAQRPVFKQIYASVCPPSRSTSGVPSSVYKNTSAALSFWQILFIFLNAIFVFKLPR